MPKAVNMTEGSPLAVLPAFAAPMIAQALLQQLYSLVGGIMLGRMLGAGTFAAVAIAGSITAVLVQLASGLSLGGPIVVSQRFGAGKTDKIWQCATTSAIFSAAGRVVDLATALPVSYSSRCLPTSGRTSAPGGPRGCARASWARSPSAGASRSR